MVDYGMWYEVVKDQRYVDTEIIDDEVIVFTWDGDTQINVYAMLPSYAEVIRIDAIPVGYVTSRDFWRSTIGSAITRWAIFYRHEGGKGRINEVIERSRSKMAKKSPDESIRSRFSDE